ncbi:MAG TPA: NAD(P)/FAD-dependent oxidoreductase [Candidatus Baltobacteraceae bacterium]|nr:NAD(P)/FAD-dependent oxidoreductase [Candidatus Baltobacteraceae bacterium]
MERNFDVVVVGSGSAGTQAALTLRERGKSVAVIDEAPFGGTCALRGCDPKKVLVHAARVVDAAQRLADIGVVNGAPAISWPDLLRFKRTFTDPVPQQRLQSYDGAGIVALRGQARFVDEDALRVEGDLLRAGHVVIASGAHEMHVAQGDDILYTSETFMDLERMPRSLLFVGGGYIAFEFAHVAARAGAQVTILNNDAHPLAGFDADIVRQLLDASRAAGITIHLETPVVSVERDADGIVARATQNGQTRAFRADAGVLAAGRTPNLEALALDAAGIERTKKGVKVNEFLQSTSNARVYAAGDAADSGGLPLTPIAAYTGEIAAQNLLSGNTRAPNFAGLATMVYTIPPLGSVGLNQAQARERGIDVDVSAGEMTDWYSTRQVAGRAACFKTVREKRTGKILGATVLGPHAEDQINVLALAIRHGLDAKSVADSLFAYPTGASDVEYMLR